MNSFKLIIGLVALGTAAAFTPQPAQAGTHVSFGIVVGTRLPHGAVRVYVGSGGRRDPFYYYGGSFYRHEPRGYVLVRPPRGAYIRHLPYGYVRVVRGPYVYFRYGGVYYRSIHDGYEVCDGPVDVVESAPAPSSSSNYDSYLSVWQGTDEYLYKDGQFFRKGPDGLVWHEVPLGAVSKHLPDDAISVWYENNEYFEADGVFFQHVRDGFKVVPKPFPAKEG